MGFDAHVLSVLIASPRDTAHERDAVENVIRSWNSDRATATRVVLLPKRWELSATPTLGRGDGQEVINDQLVDAADIVIAIFNSRVGSPTSRAISGTVEEMDRALNNGASVHPFFSEMPLPRDVKPEELHALNSYKEELQKRGLTGSYASYDDLIAKVRSCLEYDVSRHPKVGDVNSGHQRTGAILRGKYMYERESQTDRRGKLKTRKVGHRLRVENIGNRTAEDVALEIHAIGNVEAPVTPESLEVAYIRPEDYFDFRLIPRWGSGNQLEVRYSWKEDAEEHSDSQIISAF